MRLVLDTHISGKRIASALRKLGHDVRAANEEQELEALDDELLFLVALQEKRILVTSNVQDFMPIIRDWAEGGRQHAGIILISHSVRREHFGTIIRGIQGALDQFVEQEFWSDRVYWLSRGVK